MTSGDLGTAPGALPVLGHTVQFFRDPLAFLRSAQESDDVVAVRLGPNRIYLVCAPDLVRQVLLNSRVFDKGGAVYDAFRTTFGEGVGACPFEPHRRKRNLVQPAFHRTRIAAHAAMISDEVGTMTAEWQEGELLDLNAVMHRLTTTVGLRMLFGSRTTPEVVAEVHELLPVMMRGLYRRAIVPVAPLHALPTPLNRRYLATRTRLHALVEKLLAMSTEDGTVAMLRDAGLTGQELHDEVVGLLVGGVETTVATLCWTFSLLSRNPNTRRRLHAEVDSVLAGRPAVYADLPNLDYTQRLVMEVLRLYPPIWVLTRQVMEDTELGGHQLSAGATVMFSPYALHRDPNLFEAADEFDPDRWLPERATSVPQGAWIPFGAGNRKCIGDVFASVEAATAVATIAARWQLSPAGTPPRPVPRGELSTGPLPMIVGPRT
jgi:cytochrome P450